jgi:hypothetical protein
MIVHDFLFRKYRRGICVKLSYFVLLINVVSLLMCFPHNIQKIITCTKADLYYLFPLTTQQTAPVILIYALNL